MDLDEVEILPLAHKLCLAKFKKQVVPDLISLNLTHVAPSSNNSEEVNPVSTDSSPVQSYPHNPEQHVVRNGRGGGGRFPGSNVQCQVCSKFGHNS